MKAFVLAGGLWLLISSAPLAGQTSGASAGVEQHLASIDTTLREIVKVLSRLDQRQEADLILRRIELESRKIEILETQLRSRLSEQEGLEMELANFESETERLRERLFELESAGTPEAEEARRQHEQNLEQYERMAAFAEERLWNAEQKVQELENELSGPRARLRGLEAAFEESLLP